MEWLHGHASMYLEWTQSKTVGCSWRGQFAHCNIGFEFPSTYDGSDDKPIEIRPCTVEKVIRNYSLIIYLWHMTYWVGHWRTGPGSKLGNLYYIQDVPQKSVDGFKLSQSFLVTPCINAFIRPRRIYLILALWLGWEWDQVLEDHWLRWWAG